MAVAHISTLLIREDYMSDKQPNIVFFYWDNFGWGELGCYGGGVLRGAPTPRIDGLAAEGLKLLNFNVEAQCTPSRSALLTGRHAIRSGTQAVPITGGPDGLTRWEVTIAQALSDAGYATGMWGKWHLGSDPESRSPVDFGFDEAVWCPRTADEVLWTMQSYFPNGEVTAAPYAGPTKIPLEPEPIFSRKKGEKHEVVATYDAEFRAGFDRKITEWATDFMQRSKEAGKPFYVYLPYTQVHIPPIPDPEYAGKTKRGNWGDILTQMDDFTGVVLDKLDELGHRGRHDRRLGLRQRRRHHLPLPRDRPGSGGRPVERVLGAVARRLVHRARGVEPDALHRAVAGEGARREGQQRARARGRLVHDAAERRRREGPRRPDDRRHGHARLPARRRRGVGSRHHPAPPGEPAPGGQVAPVEGPPVQAGRLLLDLVAAEHAADLQPRMGPP